jgi:hypothetical protein
VTRTAWADIVPIDTLREPLWGRQKGETPKAFAAWQVYRGILASERSYQAAARELGRNRALVVDWAKRFRWQERIAAWDAHVEDLRVKAQEDAIREMDERHALIALKTLEKILERLTGDDEKGVIALNPSLLSPQDIARLSEVAVKIERLARGSETDRIEHNNAGRPVEIRLAFNATPHFKGEWDPADLPS